MGPAAIRSNGGGPVIAFVLAGGMGTRYGTTFPKQLENLAGYPVLHHTLRAFDRPDLIDRVVVAANFDWQQEILDVCDGAIRKVPYSLVEGAKSRNGSVRSCLADIDEEEARILVHDSVRPLVSRDLLTRVSTALLAADSVVPVVPSVDPVVVVDEQGQVVAFPRRAHLLRGQSPQGFWLSDLRAALLQTDEVDLELETVYAAVLNRFPEARVVAVEGDPDNIKITVPLDRTLAGAILQDKSAVWDRRSSRSDVRSDLHPVEDVDRAG